MDGVSTRQTFPIVLAQHLTPEQLDKARKSERYDPLPDQPVLRFHYASVNQISEIEEHLKIARTALENASSGGYCQAILAALRVTLAGWDHQTHIQTGEPVPFDPARLGDILGPADCGELEIRLLVDSTLQAAHLKNSGPPSPSNPAASAIAAGATLGATADTDAKIDPTPTIPR